VCNHTCHLRCFYAAQFSGASAEVLRQKVLEYTSTTATAATTAGTAADTRSSANTATATDTAATPAAATATEHQPLQSADANEEL
jgi:hypothetical protein